jgi:hypothetical protein
VPGFAVTAVVVTAVFVLDGGPGGAKAPPGPDVPAANLRPGHRFSCCEGRTRSVVLERVALRGPDQTRSTRSATDSTTDVGR